MGEVLEDMTKASREKIEKYVKELAEGENPAIMAILLGYSRIWELISCHPHHLVQARVTVILVEAS